MDETSDEISDEIRFEAHRRSWSLQNLKLNTGRIFRIFDVIRKWLSIIKHFLINTRRTSDTMTPVVTLTNEVKVREVHD